MKEEIIDGINYRLDNETLTAEVIARNIPYPYEGDFIIPETVVLDGVSYCVASIRSDAFCECTSLKSIVIPNSVTSIDDCTFEGCQSLKSVVIPNSVTIIDGYAFSGCKSLKTIDLPDSLQSIGSGAFEHCTSLTSITIPDSVTDIYWDAFEYCAQLKSVVISNSVTSIDDGAFRGCKSLTSIVVAEDNSVYDSRENCNAIIETDTNTLICGCYNTTIPNSVESIGDGAFKSCGYLASIVIPDSVKGIGTYAFALCENLNSITFQGTMEQWKKIKLGNGWNSNVPATVVHCTDGDVEIG